MEGQFERTERLLGAFAVAKLEASRVAVFGLGGVGSWVCEALARCGVGAFLLVDGDTVEKTNLNRQLIALHSTLGRPKTAVMKERLMDINDRLKVETQQLFYCADTADGVSLQGVDYVVDAIDTVACKLLLIEKTVRAGIPLISCMGTGNRLNASSFRVGKIEQTTGCPLARVMRRELKKRGIGGVQVLYSPQAPVDVPSAGQGTPPASISFVPSAAALTIAAKVVEDLTGKDFL